LVLLIQFICLQICDIVTTLVFLSFGVAEANPLVRLGLSVARNHPAAVLAALKIVGVAFGWYAWRSGRHRLLGRINLMFALCVAWNVVAIAVRW
jgi:Domain of unknown function (DUF5658)